MKNGVVSTTGAPDIRVKNPVVMSNAFKAPPRTRPVDGSPRDGELPGEWGGTQRRVACSLFLGEHPTQLLSNRCLFFFWGGGGRS